MNIFDKDFIDKLFAGAVESPRLRQNYDLRNSANDTSQRMLNALMPGTEVPIHQHTETAETVICLCGKIEEILYERQEVATDDGTIEVKFKETARYILCPAQEAYGMQIPIGVWHTVYVIEPSVIFEAKDGAYVPVK
ncbi:MAG: WbuC family cupin fold metalloprotein [Alistipes sp.]|nr:WbuC family cupin fold metalloprotein [Alistipes sp.]